MIHWRSFRSLSIRHKLLALGLLPLLLALPLLAVILMVWGDSALDALLITKIRSDLGVANGYFDRVQAEVGASTLAVAQSHGLCEGRNGLRKAGARQFIGTHRLPDLSRHRPRERGSSCCTPHFAVPKCQLRA